MLTCGKGQTQRDGGVKGHPAASPQAGRLQPTWKSGTLGSLNSCHSLRGMTSTGMSWVTTRLTLDRVGWTGRRRASVRPRLE